MKYFDWLTRACIDDVGITNVQTCPTIYGELYANGVMAVHIDVTAILVYYCSSKAAFSLNGIGINGSTEI